jgi:hypothetical protein
MVSMTLKTIGEGDSDCLSSQGFSREFYFDPKGVLSLA